MPEWLRRLLSRGRGRIEVAQKRGILLDVSFGGEPQPNSVSLLKDLKHDPRDLPWPLPAGCCHTSVVTHVLEFLDPDQFFLWFDELHRVTRDGGTAMLSGPYGGDDSVGWYSDPQHRTRVVEPTFAWLDPRSPIYQLHGQHLNRPKPKPWYVLGAARVPGTLGTYSYNATLRKVGSVDV